MRRTQLYLLLLVAQSLTAQSYFIHFPDDVITTHCSSTGAPTLYNPDSVSVTVEYTDEIIDVVPVACYRISRRWMVFPSATYDPGLPCINVPNPNPNAIQNHPTNLPGPIVSSIAAPGDPWSATVVKIAPVDPVPTNYSVYWKADANCYLYVQSIKIADILDPVIFNCPSVPPVFQDSTSNDPDLWHAPYWWDPEAGSSDLREAPVDIASTATDSCSGPNTSLRFLLFLDLDGDGVQETVVNSTNPPPPGYIRYNNASSPNFSGGTLQRFDERPGVDSLKRYRFGIDFKVIGSSRTAAIRWWSGQYPDSVTQFIPQLPPGMHKVKWFAEDGCGNEAVCEYLFRVQGGAVPVAEPAGKTGLLTLEAAPNPVREATTFFFTPDRSGPATLRVYDLSGRMLWSKTLECTAGTPATCTLSRPELGVCSGVLRCTLENESGVGSCLLVALW